MSVQSTLFNRRYGVFRNIIGNTKIEDYFGISCESGNKLTFEIERPTDTNYCLLNVQYLAKNEIFNFSHLPVSICSHILSYACNSIQLQFKILFPSTYPFTPPIWSLVDEKNSMSLSSDYNIKTYFETIAERHNEIYKRKRNDDPYSNSTNWSPAIGIDSDILYFIEKINHFDAICDL